MERVRGLDKYEKEVSENIKKQYEVVDDIDFFQPEKKLEAQLRIATNSQLFKIEMALLRLIEEIRDKK